MTHPTTGQPLILRRRSKQMGLELSQDEDDDIEEDDDGPVSSHVPSPPAEPTRIRAPQPAGKPKRVAMAPLVQKRFESLEDMTAAFPDIGDGLYRIRVRRLAPRIYAQTPIAGWLGDFDEAFTMSAFRDLFAGGIYTLCVVGPGPKPNEEGEFPTKQLCSELELRIPGLPNHAHMPISGSTGPVDSKVMNSMPQGNEAPNVAIARMNLEDKEKERQRQFVEKQMTAPEYVVKAIQDQSKQALDQFKAMADSKTETLSEQMRSQLDSIKRYQDELRELREQNAKQRTEFLEQNRRDVAEIEKRLRDAHAGQMEALKETYARERKDIEDRYREKMDDSTRRYTEDMARRNVDSMAEREKLAKDHERNERALRDTYDLRIADLQRNSERETATIRESRDREISAIKQQYEIANSSVTSTTGMRVEIMSAENARLISENARLRGDYDKLLKSSTKDPMTLIQESIDMASKLGYVSGDEARAAAAAAGGGEEGEFDWKKDGLKALLTSLPGLGKGIMEGVANARATNQQNAAAAQQAASHQALPPGPPGLIAPPRTQQVRQRRQIAPPPWTGAGAPPPYMGPIVGTDFYPGANPYQYQPPPEQPAQQQPVQYQAPVMPQPQMMPYQAQPEPAAQRQAPPPQVPADSTLTAEQQQAGIAQINELTSQIESALRSDVVPPEAFANGLVGAMGAENVRGFLGNVTIEEYFGFLEKQGTGGMIVTQVGRKYVADLWAETKKLVGMA